MTDTQLTQLWQSQNAKLDQLLSINQQLLQETIRKKAGSLLGKARPVKWFGILVGIPWLLLLSALATVGLLAEKWLFGGSMAFIALFTLIAMVNYGYHLYLINRASYADSILEMQVKIANIKTATLSSLRLVILQLPFYQTWHFSTEAMQQSATYVVVNLIITLALAALAIWLYRNIRAENTHKKWLSWLLSDVEWQSLLKAEAVLAQVKELQENT